MTTSSRKLDHIRICLEKPVDAKVRPFDDLTLVQLIVEKGVDAVNELPEGMARNPEAMAEAIENNLRRVIIDEQPINPMRTLLNSGNVVFETTAKNDKALEKQIGQQLRTTLGYEVATFIRTGR